MQLKTTFDDPDTMLFHRLESENGLIEMGVYRVMYGHRVRAGFIGKMCCELDWCGGGNWKDVERLYSLCQAILLKREESKTCFDGLPSCSEIKPFFNDPKFVKVVFREAGDFKLVSLPYRATFHQMSPEDDE